MKTDQRNRPESPETDLHKYSQLHLTKEQRQFTGESTDCLSTNDTRTAGYQHRGKKMECDPYIKPCQKSNSREFIDLGIPWWFSG